MSRIVQSNVVSPKRDGFAGQQALLCEMLERAEHAVTVRARRLQVKLARDYALTTKSAGQDDDLWPFYDVRSRGSPLVCNTTGIDWRWTPTSLSQVVAWARFAGDGLRNVSRFARLVRPDSARDPS
jgi:hypothetical protein